MSANLILQVSSSLLLWDTSLLRCVKELTAFSKASCFVKCLHDENCVSYTYDVFYSKCSLGNNRSPGSGDTRSSPGVHTYIMFLGVCPSGYHMSRQLPLCYKINRREMSWKEARIACSAKGEKLVILNTNARFTEVWNTIKNLSEHKRGSYSVGAEDLDQDHEWKWVDGKRMTYTAWRPGHPGEGSGCMNLNPGANYLWNDAVCNRKSLYICEKAISVSIFK